MGWTSELRRLRRLPGVPTARHVAEVTVTPHVRGEIAELRAALDRSGHDHQAVIDLITQLGRDAAELRAVVSRIDELNPAVMNAISSVNGLARRAERQLSGTHARVVALEAQLERIDRLEGQLPRIDRLEGWVVEHADDASKVLEVVETTLAPHVASIEFLLKRIEFVRMEALNEIRYSAPRTSDAPLRREPLVKNPTAVEMRPLRLNLGCGHVAEPDMVNIDGRDLPGVDVVASLDDLPFEAGSVDEIASAHVLEHFPRELLSRQLLPYWRELLVPGGVFRAVVPDIAAMARAFAIGEIEFEQFRSVTYGGQEYEGDAHFNGFSTDDLAAILVAAGFEQPTVVAEGRPNGECLEIEMIARRPPD